MAIYEVTLTFRFKDRPKALQRVFRKATAMAISVGLKPVRWQAKWVDSRQYHDVVSERRRRALKLLDQKTDDASGLT